MVFSEIVPEFEQNIIQDFIETHGSQYEDTALELKAPLSYIMRHWEDAKNLYLFKLLGNTLDYTFEASWGEGQKEQVKAIEDLIENQRCFIEAFQEQLNIISRFSDKLPFGLYIDLYNLVGNTNALRTNRIGFSGFFPLHDGKMYKFQENAKTIKVIGKICQSYNIPYFEEFRLAHSQVLNKPLQKGLVHISIHPLDYITMSESPDWSSCMNWHNKGDYRQGTVEMMNSKRVVVAYVARDENCEITPSYAWNNKQWRKLFIVDENLITGVRGYPQEYTDLDILVAKELKKLANQNLGWEYEDDYVWAEGCDGEGIDFYISEDTNVFWELETGWMYNDFYYNHITFRKKGLDCGGYLCYSGPCQCMVCGGVLDPEYTDDELGSYITCEGCDKGFRCNHCGDSYSEDNAVEINGFVYCPCCAENHVKPEFYSGELLDVSDMNQITVSKVENGKMYVWDKSYNCINLLYENFEKFEAEYGPVQQMVDVSSGWSHYLSIDIERLSDAQIKQWFGRERQELSNNYWRWVCSSNIPYDQRRKMWDDWALEDLPF